jgi:ribosome-associated protein
VPDLDGGPLLRLRTGAIVPRRALRMAAVTAGGAGGQHVNRSNTAVELRVALDDLPLDEAQRERVRERLGSRVTRDGDLRIEASARRSQLQNRRAAEHRLVELLDAALAKDPPRTPTRPSRATRARQRADREREQARRANRRWQPGSDGS